MKTLQTRKIQVQVTAVACPRNQHLRHMDTAIRLDGGFCFLGGIFAMAGSTIFVSEVAHEL